MITEADLIYTIWDIVRGGESNQDDPINERLMRAFLRSHRGKHLYNGFEKAQQLPDEVFQQLGELPFRLHLQDEFESVNSIPKVINVGNFGIRVDINGYYVSVVNEEEHRNAKKDRFNKFHPKCKIVRNKLYLSKGMLQRSELENFYESSLNTVVRKLNDPLQEANITANVQAVLVDPDDEPDYDFASSPYPMPDELVEDMINSVNARDFNLFLRMKSDETGDMRNDAKPQDTREQF